MTIRALIADDEPELIRELDHQLRRAWPELDGITHAENGEQALRKLQEEQPEVAFLDIRMPGLTGLEVARRLRHPCHIVFVTAYDQYAVEAFEREAVDYLLKPVREARLQTTVTRLRQRLADSWPQVAPEHVAALLSRVDHLLAQAPKPAEPPLQWLQASIGERIRLIAVADVLYLRSEDKYTMVCTTDGQYPIRTPLKELETRLDGEHFWRIHRNCMVNAHCIDTISRDFQGRYNLNLRGSPDTLVVSRSYADRFRPR